MIVLEESPEMASSCAEGLSPIPILEPSYRGKRQLVLHAGIIECNRRRKDTVAHFTMSTRWCGERKHKRCGNRDHESKGSNLAPKQESLASLILSRSNITHDAGDVIKSPYHGGFSRCVVDRRDISKKRTPGPKPTPSSGR